MISFLLCLAILIGGYFVYGKIVDNTFGPDDRETPAVRINDGVDYVVMPQWKLFLVQLLNIAGLGAGNYHVVESKVPDNMTSLVTVAFDMTITDGGKVSTSADTNKLISGQPTGDNKWTITVRNIDALTELPQTGGLLGNTMIGVVVIAMAGGVAYLTVQSKRRREAHTL